MKNIYALLAISFFVIVNIEEGYGQDSLRSKKKFFQLVTVGFMPRILAKGTITDTVRTPFELKLALAGNVTVYTPRTIHAFMWGIEDNSVKFLSGYLLPRDYDIYIVYSKELIGPKSYIGVGIERRILKLEGSSFAAFVEFRNDFNRMNTFLLGVLFNVQTIAYNR
jgi:hypothetical protein